jgi:hypothetical protein
MSKLEHRQDFSRDNDLHSKSRLFLKSALLSSRHRDSKDLAVRSLEVGTDSLRLLSNARAFRGAPNHTLVQVLIYLFIAAAFLNQVEEPLWHVRQLQALMSASKEDGIWSISDDMLVLCRLHHYDTKCALMHLRPPILDAKDLLTVLRRGRVVSTKLWSQIRADFPGAIHHPPFSKAIVKIFQQLQAHVHNQGGSTKTSDDEEGDPMESDLLWACEATALLFKHWHLSKLNIRGHATDPVSELRWQYESILSLCGLAFLGCSASGPGSPTCCPPS